MEPIRFEDSNIEVDATVVAAGLKISPALLLERLRDGTVTSRCEKGIDEDAGRYRLTFFSDTRRFQLIADANGAILQRRALDFGDEPLPASAHRPD